MIKLILQVFILLTLSWQSHAACTLSFSNYVTPINFTSNQSPGGQTFRVRKSATNQFCSYFVGFSKGTETTYNRKLQQVGGYKIDFNLRGTSNTSDPALQNYPDATSSSQVIIGSFATGNPTQNTHTYYPTSASWSTSNNLRFGLHSDTITMSVYESTFPPPASPTLIADQSVNLVYNYTVPKNAILSLLNVGQAYSDPAVATKSLSFSSMTLGQTVSFDLVLIYNAGYSVKFNSLNGQRLKHQTLTSYVPYSVSMTGVASIPSLTAGSNITVTSGSGLSPSAPTGDRRTTVFTLGNPASAFAGSYSETITITLTSTE